MMDWFVPDSWSTTPALDFCVTTPGAGHGNV